MTTAGILGVMHDDETRRKYNLGLDVIGELILEFQPDVICGEVLPGSWERYKHNRNDRGYWGEPASEYWELVFPLCEAKCIVFSPIDWGELDVWNDFDPFLLYDEPHRKELRDEMDRWFEKQLATWKAGAIPFNSPEYDAIARAKYEWLERLNPKAHLFRWVCRHMIMIQRIKNTVKQHPGKRLLCIVGADHNHALHDALGKEGDIRVVYPLRS